jgi:hypothetical protein
VARILRELNELAEGDADPSWPTRPTRALDVPAARAALARRRVGFADVSNRSGFEAVRGARRDAGACYRRR